MSLISSFRRVIPAIILFTATASAQTCYYPDGTTESNDEPCLSSSNGGASSCCPSNSFCMGNGLCFGNGVVTRSSCTDATWGSPACAGYCKTETTNGPVVIMPCPTNDETTTFACGLNASACESNSFEMSGGSGIQLRTDQVATILSSVLAATPSATAAIGQPSVAAASSAAADTAGLHTSGELAGIACGVGLPLLFALVAVLVLWRREKQKHAPPRLMYKLPDDHKEEEFTFRPPTATAASRKSAYTTTTADLGPPSDRGSFRTVGSSQNTPRVPGFAERYESIQKMGHAHEKEAREKQRHELDSSAIRDMIRHELGEGRVSR